ncbi:hypothetical protein [Nocardioides sambongensis]|uniref:hypothetical protein n=1 Tax=Nocardioides sambongensis TaxID=2589074 RepID=UPI0011262202|nr:hypothetical protein [Nocardioides sambongensis]
MAAWYLLRAVHWRAVIALLAMGGLVAAMVHRWAETATLGLPLVALLAAASAGLLVDEPAAAVVDVTPRGGRWAGSARVLAAGLPLGAGLILVSAVSVDTVGDADATKDWLVVLGALGATVLASGLALRRRVPQPGGAVASAVVLSGIAPTVVTMFIDARSPLPPPALSEDLVIFWSTLAGVGLLAILLLLGPLERGRRARSSAGPGGRSVSPSGRATSRQGRSRQRSGSR